MNRFRNSITHRLATFHYYRHRLQLTFARRENRSTLRLAVIGYYCDIDTLRCSACDFSGFPQDEIAHEHYLANATCDVALKHQQFVLELNEAVNAPETQQNELNVNGNTQILEQVVLNANVPVDVELEFRFELVRIASFHGSTVANYRTFAKRGFFLKTEENASVLKCFACGFREFAPLSFGWQNQFELHDNANPSCPLLGNWSNNVALLPDEEEALLN